MSLRALFYHLIKNRKFTRSAVAINSKLKKKRKRKRTTKSNRTSKITAVVPSNETKKGKSIFDQFSKSSNQFNLIRGRSACIATSTKARTTQPKRKEKKNKLFHFAFLVFHFFYMIYYYVARCMLRCQFRFILCVYSLLTPNNNNNNNVMPCPARVSREKKIWNEILLREKNRRDVRTVNTQATEKECSMWRWRGDETTL